MAMQKHLELSIVGNTGMESVLVQMVKLEKIDWSLIMETLYTHTHVSMYTCMCF